MSKTSKITVLVLALVMAVSMSALAVDLNFQGEYILDLESTGDELFPVAASGNKLNLRFRSSGSGWVLNMNSIATSAVNSNISLGNPTYHARLALNGTNVDIWGRGYDAGGALVKTDPVNLIVLGARGTRYHMRQSPTAHMGSTSNSNLNIAASPRVFDGVNTTVHFNHVNGSINNLSLYGDTKIADYTVGGIIRTQLQTNPDNNTTAVAAFGETTFADVNIGATVANRFGYNLQDAMAFGIVADTDLVPGIHLRGLYVSRQENFWMANAHDTDGSSQVFQRARFRNTGSTNAQGEGKGEIIELVATYRGGGPANFVNFLDIHHVVTPPRFNSFGIQGIVRRMKDESPNAEQFLIARAGFPIPVINDLYGGVDLQYQQDGDAPYGAAGVTGSDTRLYVKSAVHYDLPAKPWFVRLKNAYTSVSDGSNTGTISNSTVELVYNSGKIRNWYRLHYNTQTNWADPETQLEVRFAILF